MLWTWFLSAFMSFWVNKICNVRPLQDAEEHLASIAITFSDAPDQDVSNLSGAGFLR